MKKIIFALGFVIAIAGAGLMLFVHGAKYLSVNIALVMLGAALMRQSAYFADTLFHNASPQTFYPTAGKMIPWFAWLAVIMAAYGLYISFAIAPTDFQQGEAYRIIFVHVPAAWMSMVIYLAMAFWAAVGLALNSRLSAMMAQALAPTGAIFTFLALVTGSLWGKPMWGTYWVWDARLTSELILLFLYLGFIALQASIDDPRKADRAGALLAIVGTVMVPIIYGSVKWWNTLHQGSSINMGAAPKMASTMFEAMILMALAFWMYTIAVALMRVRCIMLERERHANWVKSIGSEGKP
ncbi:MAG TPA: heme ABC transporter permease CcmC [Methylotenera sp.]|nr:heme ABC transporter permease CcmC [Methylotenera sp.]HPH06506.1 heme ABC transporter permease CcmC [Methylotenera sp.]HPN01997.1 heme ABC transporter permease CcmC [Methylotenera sp.]